MFWWGAGKSVGRGCAIAASGITSGFRMESSHLLYHLQHLRISVGKDQGSWRMISGAHTFPRSHQKDIQHILAPHRVFNIYHIVIVYPLLLIDIYTIRRKIHSINNGTSTFSPTVDHPGSDLQEMRLRYQTKTYDRPPSGHVSSHQCSQRSCSQPSSSGLGSSRVVRSVEPPKCDQRRDSESTHLLRRPALHQRPVMLVYRAYSEYNPSSPPPVDHETGGR